MKKLIAICSVFLLVIGATNCSSDDNVVRNEISYDGTWETDKLSYVFGDYKKEHYFHEMGERPNPNSDKPTIVKEYMTIQGENVTLIEVTKDGERLKPVFGKISKEDDKEVIVFDTTNPHYTPRTLLVTPDQFATQYDFTVNMGKNDQTLPVTVTYIKK